MKYMVKSKILATFCAGLLTVSTGIQAAERLATGTQQKQAQKLSLIHISEPTRPY